MNLDDYPCEDVHDVIISPSMANQTVWETKCVFPILFCDIRSSDQVDEKETPEGPLASPLGAWTPGERTTGVCRGECQAVLCFEATSLWC